MALKIKMTPENFIKNSLIWAKFLSPFKNEVKTPARTIIKPCPIENKNNIKEASTILFVKVAKLIIPAKIGVEQGLDANANNIPTIRG